MRKTTKGNQNICLRLSPSIIEKVKKISDVRHCTISFVAECLLQDSLDRYEEKNGSISDAVPEPLTIM